MKPAINGNKTQNVLNIQMNKFRPNPDDPTNGIGLEVSIWARDVAWLQGFNKGDEIVVLGMWKHSTKTSPAPQGGRYSTFTRRRLSLTLVLKTQASKIEE